MKRKRFAINFFPPEDYLSTIGLRKRAVLLVEANSFGNEK